MSATLLLNLSFVAGAIPAHGLLAFYGFRVRWWETMAGRVLLALFAVTCLSFDLSLIAIFWPDTFKATTAGVALRAAGRLAIAAVLTALLILMLRVQRRSQHTGRIALPGTEPRKGTIVTVNPPTGPTEAAPAPPAKGPVETKTWAALAGGLASGLVLAVLNALQDPSNAQLLGGLPSWLQFIVVTALGGAVPGAGAYLAPHTHRTDRAALAVRPIVRRR